MEEVGKPKNLKHKNHAKFCLNKKQIHSSRMISSLMRKTIFVIWTCSVWFQERKACLEERSIRRENCRQWTRSTPSDDEILRSRRFLQAYATMDCQPRRPTDGDCCCVQIVASYKHLTIKGAVERTQRRKREYRRSPGCALSTSQKQIFERCVDTADNVEVNSTSSVMCRPKQLDS